MTTTPQEGICIDRGLNGTKNLHNFAGLYISTKNSNFSVTNFENGNFSMAYFINKKAFLKVIVHF